MRIVQAVNWSVPAQDAAVDQAVNTAAALARNGAEVTLLLPRTPGDPMLDPADFDSFLDAPARFAVEQWPVPAFVDRRLRPLAWLWRCQTAASTRRCDLILTRAPVSMVVGAGPGRRFVFDSFRTWPDNYPFLRGMFRRGIASPRCLGLLLHSDYAAQSFLALGVDPGKILVAHNGVNLARFSTALSPVEARARVKLDPARKIVAYAGRLAPWKGVGVLLDIARARPGLQMVLAGSRGDGPIEAAARELPNVHVLPWQDPEQLAVLLAAADVLALPPSRRGLETQKTVLPIKTFAYLAAGKPILGPRLPDSEGLLVDGENALLVEPDDLAAALEGLDRLLGDRELAERLGAAGRRLARGKTWDARAKSILPFLEARLAAAGTAA
jgi:glycosyltransferase involved in cell wall biosynthesis